MVSEALGQLRLLRFDLLARGIVGADQQVADDRAFRIPECGDRDDRRQAAAVLADVRQLVDVLDAAGGLEHQRLEAGCDGCFQLTAERLGAGDDLQGIRDIRRGDPVHHVGSGVTQHAFRADVEDLDDTFRVGGNAGEIRAVENGALQGSRLQQRFLGTLACRVVGTDQQVADDPTVRIAQCSHRDDRRKAAAVLADIGQFVDILDAPGGLEHQRLEPGGNPGLQFRAQRLRAGYDFQWLRDVRRRDPVDHVCRGVPEHALRTDIEDLDDAVRISGNAGEIRAVEDCPLQRFSPRQSGFQRHGLNSGWLRARIGPGCRCR